MTSARPQTIGSVTWVDPESSFCREDAAVASAPLSRDLWLGETRAGVRNNTVLMNGYVT